jgi:hypothetical protein
MGLIDVVKVLGYGVIGLGFLLAFMAYRLLSAEQKKIKPTDRMLKAIREYMFFSIAITILGGVFLLADKFIPAPKIDNGEITKPTPCPTITPNPVKVEISESIGNELRNIELVDGAAKITVKGFSEGVFGTKARVYACSQYDEDEWWCKYALVNDDGTWKINLYPKGSNPPFKDGSEIKLRAFIDLDGNLANNQSIGDEIPDKNIDRFSVKSSMKNVRIFLKK